jgi:hypothetical protein
MFISSAYAQSTGAAGGFATLLPLLLIGLVVFAIWYFGGKRHRRKLAEEKEMLTDIETRLQNLEEANQKK